MRLKAAVDPDLSPDGRKVAFLVVETDVEADRLRQSIWVAAVDGGTPPRQFTEGPADASPRWSPDGRWLAFISITDEVPEHAHVRLASLDGGAPLAVGDLPGPVSQLAWSPDSRRLAVVCRVGVPNHQDLSATERNAPRRVRGLAARLDGVGWQEGRRHLFIVEVDGGATRQLTRGEFDHSDPSFSPDGRSVVCSSDRTRRRDDRQFRSDAWIFSLDGGHPRRLTDAKGAVTFPAFSPDGALIAFTGNVTEGWDEDSHVYVVPADGSGPPDRVDPELDRPTPIFMGPSPPHRWTGERELTMIVADRGAQIIRRATLGERRGRVLVEGDVEVSGFAARVGRRAIAYTGAWPDRPSEIFAQTPGSGSPAQLTNLNGGLLEEVELAPIDRVVITRADGIEVEYFTMLPPDRPARGLPMHLDIHGGPYAWWPSSGFTGVHQALAGAGYCVLLPNPRGSASYGQQFTAACTQDWGGGDCEDILACCDDLIERGVVDPQRMFLGGGSYGGFMTSWIVGHTDRFRAATALAAVIDQTSMSLTTEIPEFSRFSMGGTPWERRAEHEKRSPLTYLPEVRTPVLVVHWEGDIRVPISQGDELYAGLKLLGREVEYLRYPGGFHTVQTPSQWVDATRQTLVWNKRHDKRSGTRKR